MRIIKHISILLALVVTLAACQKNDNTIGATSGSPDNSSATGQGGSLARFTIAGNHLYVVDDMKLHTYSLANPSAPLHTSSVQLGENIETIYSYKDRLFIGSQTAMYIYSISDAAHPSRLGTASHVRACDPVVADDDIAYVTVRSGTNCGGIRNALLVYDVKNLLKPRLINEINTDSPWGLGMKGNTLFVCNGSSGLSIYDISKKNQPSLTTRIYDDTFYDVIVLDDLLVCMVEGGTLLYELKGDGQIVKMAKIAS